MRQLSGSDAVLRILGLLLLTAAVLKGHELLTVPVANRGLWTWRPFLIFQAECELALGLWLLSGLFKRLAWLATLLCFGLFCCVTLYKSLTGAASCGCFGTVHVNPWLTLSAIDLPAVVALTLFRPPLSSTLVLSFLRRQESISGTLGSLLKPMPSLPRFAATAASGLVLLGLTTPILALNEPALVTSRYEVLEPEMWVGKELPILEYIDIADQLKQGTWLVVLYQHDCPHCREAIPKYRPMTRRWGKEGVAIRMAFIEIPPYGRALFPVDSGYTLGRLADVKEWFAMTPVTALLVEGKVKATWEESVPEVESIYPRMTRFPGEARRDASSSSVSGSTGTPKERR